MRFLNNGSARSGAISGKAVLALSTWVEVSKAAYSLFLFLPVR